MKKYVVSSTLQQLKQEPGGNLAVGGLTLPLALADLGLIDEYEFLVQPVLAGHGPTLFAGRRERTELTLVGRHEFRSGAVALRCATSRGASRPEAERHGGLHGARNVRSAAAVASGASSATK